MKTTLITLTCMNCGYAHGNRELRCYHATAKKPFSFTSDARAEALAESIMKAAGSSLKHYMPSSKAKIIHTCFNGIHNYPGV